MVPYVRKSFRKHWNNGIEYIGKALEPDVIWEKENRDNVPISEYQEIAGHEKIYKYALDQTKKEIHQAVEGMFHNLRFGHNISDSIMNLA